MVSRPQTEACMRLEKLGLASVGMPCGENTPIPGLILMADEGHTKLMLVQPDGIAIDILKVYRLAETCIRDWQKEGTMPGFVGDFKRLNPLAKALNGKPYALPATPNR